jgi:hypothetical protein
MITTYNISHFQQNTATNFATQFLIRLKVKSTKIMAVALREGSQELLLLPKSEQLKPTLD